MIYEFPDPDQPIRQGDIFKSLPRVFIDPEDLIFIEEDKILREHKNWSGEIHNQPIDVVATVAPSYGIVITQDCDTTRDKYIAFLEIRKFLDVYKQKPPEGKSQEKILDWWIKTLTRSSREDVKWFYLPPDKKMGFEEKMAANFQEIFTVRTKYLENNLSSIRIGRLYPDADEHFREQIAQYFRRYPVNAWYPLNKEEFDYYTKDSTKTNDPPYDWQK
jgi:hypothetical protein